MGLPILFRTSGAAVISGTMAATQPAATGAASGREVIRGPIAVSQAASSSAAAGREVIRGPVAVSQAASSAAASGLEKILATAASVQLAATGSATGTVEVEQPPVVEAPSVGPLSLDDFVYITPRRRRIRIAGRMSATQPPATGRATGFVIDDEDVLLSAA